MTIHTIGGRAQITKKMKNTFLTTKIFNSKFKKIQAN